MTFTQRLLLRLRETRDRRRIRAWHDFLDETVEAWLVEPPGRRGGA